MKNLKKLSSLFTLMIMLMASTFMFTACNDDEPDPDPIPEDTILEIVAESPNHTQLNAFLTANSDLVGVLSGNGPLTLFAPDDNAFEKLRVTLGVDDLAVVNPNVIALVLAFHVHTGGAVRRADMSASTTISTVQSEEITFNQGGNIATGGSDTDVEFIGDEILATNGVVHVVETILIPPTVFATIGANLGKVSQTVLLGADFSTLASAIEKADEYAADEGMPLLTSVLAGNDPITVFAPINQVFETAGITLETFTGAQWYGIIATHVVVGQFLAADLQARLQGGNNTLPTASQKNIQFGPTVFMENQTFSIGGAPVVAADITSENGVVHAVAGVVSSVNTYTTVLLGGQGNSNEGFYNAFSNVKYNYAQARDASGTDGSPVDLAYYFGNTNKATLAAIDAGGLHAVYNAVGLPIEGIFGTRNSTRFRVTDLSPQQFGGIILDAQLAQAAASELNTNNSATELQAGSVVAFTLDDDRGGYVGLIRVVEIDDTNGEGTITIEVKVQVSGNN